MNIFLEQLLVYKIWSGKFFCFLIEHEIVSCDGIFANTSFSYWYGKRNSTNSIIFLEKLRQQDIAKDVAAAARLAANNLPDFLEECAIVYLPEMGHLIAIKKWEPDCNPEDLEHVGYKFLVSI